MTYKCVCGVSYSSGTIVYPDALFTRELCPFSYPDGGSASWVLRNALEVYAYSIPTMIIRNAITKQCQHYKLSMLDLTHVILSPMLPVPRPRYLAAQ